MAQATPRCSSRWGWAPPIGAEKASSLRLLFSSLPDSPRFPPHRPPLHAGQRGWPRELRRWLRWLWVRCFLLREKGERSQKETSPARLSWTSTPMNHRTARGCRSHNAGALQSDEAPHAFTDIPHSAALLPTPSRHLKQYLGRQLTCMHPLALSSKVPRHRGPV